jgi:hypothetical protein
MSERAVRLMAKDKFLEISPTHWWLGKIPSYLVWLLTFQSSVDVILATLGAILPFCWIGNM